MSISPEQLSAELDRYLTQKTRQGWEIVSRTPTTAQIRRRANGLGCGIVAFILLPLLAGVLLHPLFYTIALVGLVVVGIGAAGRRDSLHYITEAELTDRLTKAKK